MIREHDSAAFGPADEHSIGGPTGSAEERS
jgi:hypothetical protein